MSEPTPAKREIFLDHNIKTFTWKKIGKLKSILVYEIRNWGTTEMFDGNEITKEYECV